MEKKLRLGSKILRDNNNKLRFWSTNINHALNSWHFSSSNVWKIEIAEYTAFID